MIPQGENKGSREHTGCCSVPRPQQCHSHGVWVLWTDAAHALALWLSSTISNPPHLFLSLWVAVPAQTLSRWPRPAPATHETVSACAFPTAPAPTPSLSEAAADAPVMDPSTTRKEREDAQPGHLSPSQKLGGWTVAPASGSPSN